MSLLHLGDLHAYEQVLVGVLALAPFLVLAFVVHVVRRRDLAEEREEGYADGGLVDGGSADRG